MTSLHYTVILNDLTDGQIRSLQTEAAQTGDLDMVSICHTACGDHEESNQEEIQAARETCARAIAECQAQNDA